MDSVYWNKFYKKFSFDIPSSCSTFAEFCVAKKAFEGLRILELGSGNGRDSRFFCANGFEVLAVDQIDPSGNLENYAVDGLEYRCSDFCAEDLFSSIAATSESIGLYSRFSLHAISETDQMTLMARINSCQNIGVLAIEARSIYDRRFGVGEPVGRNAFIDTHYRRFIDPEELYEEISKEFLVKYFEVADGLSVFKDDDPVVVRLVGNRR